MTACMNHKDKLTDKNRNVRLSRPQQRLVKQLMLTGLHALAPHLTQTIVAISQFNIIVKSTKKRFAEAYQQNGISGYDRHKFADTTCCMLPLSKLYTDTTSTIMTDPTLH